MPFFDIFMTFPKLGHRNHNKSMQSAGHHKIMSLEISFFSRFQISGIHFPVIFLAPVSEKNFFLENGFILI